MPRDLLAEPARSPRDLLAGIAPASPPKRQPNRVSRALSGVADNLLDFSEQRAVPRAPGSEDKYLTPSDVPDALIRGPAMIGGGLARFLAEATDKPLKTAGQMAYDTATIPNRIAESATAVGPQVARGEFGKAGQSVLDTATGAAELATLGGAPLVRSVARQGLKGAERTAAETSLKMKAPAGKVEPPTSEEIKALAGEKYREAEQIGVVASPRRTQGLHASMKGLAEKEGLVTPKSGVVDESMPKVRAVLRMTEEYSGSPMTPTQMLSVRRTLQNAAGSADAAERRVGSLMLRKYDEFAESMAPQFADARKLYHRAKKAETLEQARELAGARAGQFTGSGFENALRTEYRAIDRRIIKGKERGFTPEEQKAIQAVSRGTGASNIARNVGRMAPTSALTQVSTVGLPYLAGSFIGGPVMGAAAGFAGAGLGYGGRALATRLSIKAADTAELLVRAGVPQKKVKRLTPAQREELAAYLAAQGGMQTASRAQEGP